MKKIFILTGEPSGDKLASTIISKLQKEKLMLNIYVLVEII
jgi:lipid A disaccharide synthetase